MVSAALYTGLVGLVALERLAELRLATRNAARAFAQGGQERGQAHYRVMKGMHTAFLVACPAEVWLLHRPFVPALGVSMLVLVCATMALRYWAILTLGERWNTRVIVVPGLPAVNGGPYRWIRHPNYVAVILELLALPLVHTAWITAAVFTLANLALLRVRVRVEEAALRELCDYDARLADRPRGVP